MKSSFEVSLLSLRSGDLTCRQLGEMMQPYLPHANPLLWSASSDSLLDYSDVATTAATVQRLRNRMIERRGLYLAYGIAMAVKPPKGRARRHVVGLLTVDQQPYPLATFRAGPLLSVWIAPAEHRPTPSGRLLPHVLDLLTEALTPRVPNMPGLSGYPWALVSPTDSYAAEVLTQTAAFSGFELYGEVPPDGNGPARHRYTARSKIA